MGCWNGTCGFSNLPIRAGQKVVAFIIDEQGYVAVPGRGEDEIVTPVDKVPFLGSPDMSYSWTPHMPMSLPLVGEYNDYGSIENIEDNTAARVLLKFFNERLAAGDFDQDWAPDDVHIPKPTKFESIEDVCDAIERGKLYAPRVEDGNLGGWFHSHFYRLYMVHYDIYEALTKTSEEKKAYAISTWKAPQGVDQEVGRSIRWALGYQRAPRALFDSLLTDLTWEELNLGLEVRTEEEDALIERYRKCYYYENHKRVDLIDLEQWMSNDFRHFADLLLGNPMKDYVDDLLKAVLFFQVVSGTRRHFGPVTGAGSQSQDYDLYKKVHKVIGAQLKAELDQEAKNQAEHRKWEAEYRAQEKAKKNGESKIE